jgi:hypothetical protein
MLEREVHERAAGQGKRKSDKCAVAQAASYSLLDMAVPVCSCMYVSV